MKESDFDSPAKKKKFQDFIPVILKSRSRAETTTSEWKMILQSDWCIISDVIVIVRSDWCIISDVVVIVRSDWYIISDVIVIVRSDWSNLSPFIIFSKKKTWNGKTD